MGNESYIQNINSKYVLKVIFSHLQLNTFYKIVKYKKTLQNKLNINWKDSIFNYQYVIKTKNDIIQSFEEIQDENKYRYVSELSYSGKFVLKYHYHFAENINDKDIKVKFLIKYKGFKINDYPLPFDFNSLSFLDKMNIFKKNESYFKYSLNDENIELITIFSSNILLK